MKKATHIVLKIILTLLLISPVLGALGIFPPPAPEMYTNMRAYDFIKALMDSYVIWGISITSLLVIVLIWAKREALAALLLLPLAVNIVGFHATLDGGLFTVGAIMGNVLFLINIYLLYKNRSKYSVLLAK